MLPLIICEVYENFIFTARQIRLKNNVLQREFPLSILFYSIVVTHCLFISPLILSGIH